MYPWFTMEGMGATNARFCIWDLNTNLGFLSCVECPLPCSERSSLGYSGIQVSEVTEVLTDEQH